MYHYHFKLLAHLRHGHLINIPYFLYGMLKQMASHIWRAKHPTSSVNHHGLIKLLSLCSLARQGRRWDEVSFVLEEGSAAKVLTQHGGAMSEQDGMHVGEHSRRGSQEEKDDAATSNAEDFVDQTDHEEFSKEAEPAYHSHPKIPRSNKHENETIKEQSTR